VGRCDQLQPFANRNIPNSVTITHTLIWAEKCIAL